MGRYLIIFFLFIFSIGCAPPNFNPKKIDNIKFEKSLHYETDISGIIKPEKLNVIYINNDFKEVPIKEATQILLSNKEYNKIPALLRVCKTYKDIIYEQEKLINIKVDEINSYKEFIKLEQMKKDGYFELWTISENSYRQERYNASMNRFTSYLYFETIIIVFLIVIILAL